MSRRKRRVKLISCPNCGYSFTDVNYNFCPSCGQENHTHNLPIKHFVMETLETLTHFDTKFITTVKDLLLKPGLAIKNFNENKRARYVPPIRIYVFTSFIFFIIVSLLFSHDIENLDSKVRSNFLNGTKGQIVLFTTTNLNSLDINELKNIKELDNQKIETVLRARKIETDWFNTRIVNSIVKLQTGKLTVSDLYKKFIKYLSYSLFIFMPFFAFLLYLFYIRRHRYYSEFLIFSIYYHTFIFGLLGIMLLLSYFLNISYIITLSVFFILMFIYLGKSVKTVFDGGLGKTIFKTVLLSITYLICLSFLFGFLVLGSML